MKARKRQVSMATVIAAPVAVPGTAQDARALKIQSRYGESWRPGEVPSRGTLRPVIGALGERNRSYDGREYDIEKPKARGKGRPTKEGQL